MPVLAIRRLDKRPDLIDRVYEVGSARPELMGKDPVLAAFGGARREMTLPDVEALNSRPPLMRGTPGNAGPIFQISGTGIGVADGYADSQMRTIARALRSLSGIFASVLWRC